MTDNGAMERDELLDYIKKMFASVKPLKYDHYFPELMAIQALARHLCDKGYEALSLERDIQFATPSSQADGGVFSIGTCAIYLPNHDIFLDLDGHKSWDDIRFAKEWEERGQHDEAILSFDFAYDPAVTVGSGEDFDRYVAHFNRFAAEIAADTLGKQTPTVPTQRQQRRI